MEWNLFKAENGGEAADNMKGEYINFKKKKSVCLLVNRESDVMQNNKEKNVK